MWKELKPLFVILGRFLGLGLGLFLIYQLYLNYFSTSTVDPYTRIVANQTVFLLNRMGYAAVSEDLSPSLGILLTIKNIPATRIVEGCNAISVMILFASFILAFYQGKKTWLYLFAGIIALFLVNLIRILILNIVVVDWPEYTTAAHDYFFPSAIYGMVVVLWLVWIQFFAVKKVQNE